MQQAKAISFFKLRQGKFILLLISLLLGGATVSAGNWPQWRGPHSQGVSFDTGLPVRWSATENVKWKTPLPGPGHSSPIIWGDRIFLTAYRASGSQLLVLCLDRNSGQILWERPVAVAKIESVHPTNAPASPTPVTDGQRVYVHFGSRGLVCLDFAGNIVWERKFGPYPNEWGTASSPILYKNLLVLNSDTDAEDFLLAVNKNTGKTVWMTPRSDVTRAWPTPFIWGDSGQDEIVVSGSGEVKSYDPQTGRELWKVEGLTKWVTPTPVTGHGLLYVTSNGPGGNVTLAIRPGGRGNITNSHVVWRYDRSAPYSSSPVIYHDYLYSVKNGGVMTCLNAKTGALVWQDRLPARGDYFASLVAAEDKIYALSEDGEVTVVAAKPTFQVLSSNRMGERCMASPAIANGQIFIRSDKHLFCISR